jgi:hypothetical protein
VRDDTGRMEMIIVAIMAVSLGIAALLGLAAAYQMVRNAGRHR